MLEYSYFRAKHYSAAAITLHCVWTQKPSWVMNKNFFEIGFVHTKVAEQTCSMFVTRVTLFFVMHVKSAIECIYSYMLNI